MMFISNKVTLSIEWPYLFFRVYWHNYNIHNQSILSTQLKTTIVHRLCEKEKAPALLEFIGGNCEKAYLLIFDDYYYYVVVCSIWTGL